MNCLGESNVSKRFFNVFVTRGAMRPQPQGRNGCESPAVAIRVAAPVKKRGYPTGRVEGASADQGFSSKRKTW